MCLLLSMWRIHEETSHLSLSSWHVPLILLNQEDYTFDQCGVQLHLALGAPVYISNDHSSAISQQWGHFITCLKVSRHLPSSDI